MDTTKKNCLFFFQKIFYRNKKLIQEKNQSLQIKYHSKFQNQFATEDNLLFKFESNFFLYKSLRTIIKAVIKLSYKNYISEAEFNV